MNHPRPRSAPSLITPSLPPLPNLVGQILLLWTILLIKPSKRISTNIPHAPQVGCRQPLALERRRTLADFTGADAVARALEDRLSQMLQDGRSHISVYTARPRRFEKSYPSHLSDLSYHSLSLRPHPGPPADDHRQLASPTTNRARHCITHHI